YVLLTRPPPRPTLFPYTTLFRSGRVRVLLQLEQLAEPRQVAVELVRALPFLEEPVRRDAVLGGVMHLAGADLDLVQLAAGPEHRSEEHTSELQSRENLVCRLLLE